VQAIPTDRYYSRFWAYEYVLTFKQKFDRRKKTNLEANGFDVLNTKNCMLTAKPPEIFED
jgi:hypothetical protein